MPRLRLLVVVTVALFALVVLTEARIIHMVEGSGPQNTEEAYHSALSPYWEPSITRWSAEILREARLRGLDPDFIAAVMRAESNGFDSAVSRVGAVGLMGVMPTGPGLEWRPSPEDLMDPTVNINWGVAILASIIQQSGGDIVAALAAYSGGWAEANGRVPRQYASQVLDSYGRAVAARSGISPEIAAEWTVATQISRGHVPLETLILSEPPLSGLHTFGEHVVYRDPGIAGRAYFVKGYAVPLALLVPLRSEIGSTDGASIDERLMVRLGAQQLKSDGSNPHVILACLPSISRLRGRLATRWFSPSDCPLRHR
jgi:hypothetical protein